MADIVEVFWNARPYLDRLGVKVGGGELDPRADRMFREVRASMAEAFPGRVTLVRIAVRAKDRDDTVRVVGCGTEADPNPSDLHVMIEQAVERATAEVV